MNKRNKYHKKYKNLNKHKIKAQNIAFALYPIPQKCTVSNCEDIGERHHIDYAYPEEIIWLCKKHHRRTHYPTVFCKRTGCNRRSHARKLCAKHYQYIIDSKKRSLSRKQAQT